MVLLDDIDTRLVYFIDSQTYAYLSSDSSNMLSVLSSNPECILYASEVLSTWNIICDLSTTTDTIDKALLTTHLDNHYNSINLLASTVISEIKSLNQTIIWLKQSAYIVVMLMAANVLMNLFYIKLPLNHSRELSRLASIDTETGLFNRSKCQELFINESKSTDINKLALIVIDINDLRKINDINGGKVGNELVYYFASLLKLSSNVHDIRPFLGRYGGDKFIVYYRKIKDESEISIFLEELDYQTSKFNRTESRFKISFASGYAVSDGSIDVRQLFDIAEENMLRKKKLMKSDDDIKVVTI